MLKKCLKLFITGLVFTIIGAIGIAVFAVNATPENVSSQQFIIEETEEITSLNFEIDAGSLMIVQGDSFAVEYTGVDFADLEYEISDGCLEIDCSGGQFTTFYFDDVQSTNAIIVTVPERSFKNVELSMDAGEIIAENITADKFIFDMSAGNAELSGIKSLKSTLVNMDAGNCTFTDSTLNKMEANVDLGVMDLDKCVLSGTNDVNLDCGKINMVLLGKRDEYELVINNDLGKVSVDGVTYHGNEYSNGDSVSPIGKINVNLDLGECNIEFTKET